MIVGWPFRRRGRCHRARAAALPGGAIGTGETGAAINASEHRLLLTT
jgi:hypothetical protein